MPVLGGRMRFLLVQMYGGAELAELVDVVELAELVEVAEQVETG